MNPLRLALHRLRLAWVVLWRGLGEPPPPQVVERIVERVVEVPVLTLAEATAQAGPTGRWRVEMRFGEETETVSFGGAAVQSRWWDQKKREWTQGAGRVPTLALYMDGDARRDWWPREE